jgi:hypothetical protein
VFEFGLPLFPFASSAITITTTVWVGVCIAVFFNLRFGWTLSGLVIPGYLTPLLLTRPIAAAVILVEAMLTYLIVVAISEWPRKLPFWCSFFGRDRFFAILVVSVIVRATLDGWVLPALGKVIVEDYGINFDYRNNLQSFGLIAVALIANYFWKPGVLRGLAPLLTTVGLTFAVIQYPLIGLTNFNVGNFHLLYEDISTSLLASPKAYIIVLMTAYLASCFNLRYAWDFNGILIPALLGLLWHQPVKILFSSLECILILSIASYLLRTPLFRRVTIEGGRKMLFFFTICFVYRLVLCHLLPVIGSGVEISDTFGFGYLLSTLMAVKAHDKRLVVRMIRSITEVSMLGAVAGSLIGFAFYCGPDLSFHWTPSGRQTAGNDFASLQEFDEALSQLIRRDKILLYEKQKPESYVPPVPYEMSVFRKTLADIKHWSKHERSRVENQRSGDPSQTDVESLRVFARQLARVNYEMSLIQQRYLYLREKSPANGWGIYVIDLQATSDALCVEVPRPLEEKATIESGLCIFQRFNSIGLAIAGAPRDANITGSADVTVDGDTFFREFHDAFGKSNPLHVRALPDYDEEHPLDEVTQHQSTHLWLTGSIPSSLKLRELKGLIGSYQVNWNIRSRSNLLQRRSPERFAELVLGEQDRRELIGQLYQASANRPDSSATDYVLPRVFKQNLRDWLAEKKDRICQQGSGLYQPATVEQMLYMDHEVVSPLLKLAARVDPTAVDTRRSTRFWETPEFISHWLPVQAAASGLGYEIAIVDDDQTGNAYLALVESPASPGTDAAQSKRGWGTFVLRPGLREPFAVEIPRPLFERRSFEFGVNLFERPRGSALLVAGSHPFANADGSSDISKVGNKVNLFNLFRHVLLRDLPQRPLLITQARAIQAPVDADVVVATDDGSTREALLTPLKKQLLAQLGEDRLDVAFVDGRHETAGYELGILMQATAVQVSANKEVVSLWLSPSLRTKFREQSDNNALASQFEICNLPTIQMSLVEYLQRFSQTESPAPKHQLVEGATSSAKHQRNERNNVKAGLVPTSAMRAIDPIEAKEANLSNDGFTPMPPELRVLLRQYIENYDVLLLMQAKRQFANWQLVRLVDGISGQAFLLISKRPEEIPTVLNLTGYVSERVFKIDCFDIETVNAYIRSRALWLEPVAVIDKQSVVSEPDRLGGRP